MIRKQASGLGNRRGVFRPSAWQDMCCLLLGKLDIRDLCIPVEKILPLPIMFRAVSGKKTSIKRRHIPERMVRNQKIYG